MPQISSSSHPSRASNTFLKYWCQLIPSLHLSWVSIRYDTEHRREGIWQLCKTWVREESSSAERHVQQNVSVCTWRLRKMPRRGVWGETYHKLFNMKLGLFFPPHKTNLPPAVKESGDCGEFWAFPTDLSCFFCVRESNKLPSSSEKMKITFKNAHIYCWKAKWNEFWGYPNRTTFPSTWKWS